MVKKSMDKGNSSIPNFPALLTFMRLDHLKLGKQEDNLYNQVMGFLAEAGRLLP